MIANCPVAKSAGARVVFLAGAAVTVAVMLWAHEMLVHGTRGLSLIFYILFTYFDYRAAMWLLVTMVVAVFVPNSAFLQRTLHWLGDHPCRTSLCAAGVLCCATFVVYHNHPLAMDEYAVLFQSKVFAAGHLAGRFPPQLLDWLIPHGFQDYFLNVSPVTGRVASSYWPSFSLLLAPFTWAGIPWALNPALSALTLLAIHRLAMLTFDDREAAGLALLLTLASPVFFADGISYYSMSAHLLANTVYAILLARPTPYRAVAAGIVGSVALTLHNPVPHILFSLPWLFWVARRENGLRLLACLSAGYLPLCLLLGIGWFMFSMHLMHEGMHTAAGAASADGLRHVLSAFGLPNSTVLRARAIGLAKVWLWAAPGVVLLALAGAWQWRHHTICRLLTASAILTLAGYLFVPVDQGHGWGFRYFHSAWVALPILAAATLVRPPGFERKALFADGDTRTFVTACALIAFVGAVGVRAVQIRGFIADDLSQLPTYSGTEPHVVFVDTNTSFYGADLIQNDPWLRGDTIRMLSHGARDDGALMHEYFPGLHRIYADRHGTVWSRSNAAGSRLAASGR